MLAPPGVIGFPTLTLAAGFGTTVLNQAGSKPVTLNSAPVMPAAPASPTRNAPTYTKNGANGMTCVSQSLPSGVKEIVMDEAREVPARHPSRSAHENSRRVMDSLRSGCEACRLATGETRRTARSGRCHDHGPRPSPDAGSIARQPAPMRYD